VSDDDKQYEPSAQRLQQAREKGDLPRSRLLGGAATLLGGTVGLLASGPEGAARLEAYLLGLLIHPPARPQAALDEAVWVLAWTAGPPVAGAFVGGLAAAVASVGFDFRPALVAPDVERVSPAKGLERLLGVKQQALELGKGLLVAAVMLGFMASAVVDAAPDALRAVHHDGALALRVVLQGLAGVLPQAAGVLALLGLLDFGHARHAHHQKLMMSREEVKQEHKQSEGDPHHKAHRKQLHRQLAQGGPQRGARKATAVVVNPTHIAVALRYDESECEAPYLVAKGYEADALAIRQEALAHRVPVVRDVPLARSLVHYDVGEAIPEELYQAAAAVLSVALQSRGAGTNGAESRLT
jgi:type III secretion protein U